MHATQDLIFGGHYCQHFWRTLLLTFLADIIVNIFCRHYCHHFWQTLLSSFFGGSDTNSIVFRLTPKFFFSSYKNDDSYSNKYSGVTLPPKKLDNNVCQK
jgi:hypothetical protein